MYSGHFCLIVNTSNFTMKITCAGFPKTGTKSMATALRQLGYSVNDFPEHLHGGLNLLIHSGLVYSGSRG